MTVKVLSASALNATADFTRDSYHVEVNNDVTLDDILRPAFWAHHMRKLKKNALIDIVRADGSLDVQVRVTDVGLGFATVRPLRVWEDPEVAAARAATEQAVEAHNATDTAIPSEYKISHNARTGFTVTYLATGETISKGHKLRGDAVNAVRAHATKAGIAWPEPEPQEKVA
jgi:hypothetical protein